MMSSNNRSMLFDKIVVFLLYCMAVIPFAQVFHLNVGVAILNAYEILLSALFFIFVLIIIRRGISKAFTGYVFFVVAMFVVYSSYSLVVLDVGFSAWVNQTRNFLPFIVACMALLTRLYINRSKFLNGLTFVLAASAILAIIIHLFFKDFIASSFAASDEVSIIILQGGRMYWGAGGLALFGFTAFMSETDKRKKRLLRFAVFAIFVATLFTQNRTIPAGLLFFYFSVQFFVYKKPIRPFIYTSIFIFISAVIFFFLASDNMTDLLQHRFLLTDSAGAEIERAFFVGRVGLYEQYLDRLFSTFPFGQGLGIPFSYRNISGVPAFTSDISLISFAIPFGLSGILAIVIFIAKLFKVFNKYKKAYRNNRTPSIFTWLLVTACFMSLNVDIFSRNIFVVYLAVFAVLHALPSVKRMRRVYI